MKFLTKDIKTNERYTVETKYNDAEIDKTKSVEKSKQFLGLLRNTEGKCAEDNCFTSANITTEDPIAIECAMKATFDEDGINVKYKIPERSREEYPLNKLQTGINMMYSRMLLNVSGETDVRETGNYDVK